MNRNEYNGWTNYETWLVNLWQDNDQGEQTYWQEQAEGCLAVDSDRAVISLADIMREHYESASADLSGVTGFWADLLGAALSEVNWREIAQHRIGDAVDATNEVQS